jgi:ADP-heptose:LPS heptosyltransferase
MSNDFLTPKNPYHVTLVEEEKQFEIFQKAVETERATLEAEQKEAEKRAERLKHREEERRKNVFHFFKVFAKRDMTEEEYKNYIEILEDANTRNGYNIKNFIAGDMGKSKKDGENINNGSGEA